MIDHRTRAGSPSRTRVSFESIGGLIANAISLGESSFQNSGILFSVDPADVTGSLPTPGMAIAAAGGATVATELHGSKFIEMLRNRSRVLDAGATVMGGLVGNVAIPRP